MPVRKKVNKDFFKIWSPGMAYVLGFFAADGNLINTNKGGYYLSFYSADQSLLAMLKKVMGSEHKLSKRSIKSGEVYRFQIGSKEMFNDLLALGFTGNKNKRLKLPKIPQRFIDDFIRGYFDGDGNVWGGLINKKRKTPTKVLQVAFTSGCMVFLEDFLSLLKIKGLQGGSIYSVKNKQCWRLSFSTLDALKLYKIMYNVSVLYLNRKKVVFEKFINMRP